ncbi:cilia- and flagella-associated protein 251 [Ambystoma mexicanum]|uniref:cilia- and flagella-associated protein 251 n=1 Tax=Ambystoma mexicanum TaxID=8296 RepID=UPI0037E88265
MAEPGEIPTQEADETKEESKEQSDVAPQLAAEQLGVESESPMDTSTPTSVQQEDEHLEERTSEEIENTVVSTEPTPEAESLNVEQETEAIQGEAEELSIPHSASPESVLIPPTSSTTASSRESINETTAGIDEIPEETAAEAEESYEEPKDIVQDQVVLQEQEQDLTSSEKSQEMSVLDVKKIEQPETSLSDAGESEQQENTFSDVDETEEQEASLSGVEEIVQQEKSFLDAGEIEHQDSSLSGVEEIDKQERSFSDAGETEEQETSPSGVEEIDKQEMLFLDMGEIEEQETSLSDVEDIDQQEKSLIDMEETEQQESSLSDAEESKQLETSFSDITVIKIMERSPSGVSETKQQEQSFSALKEIEQQEISLTDVKELEKREKSISSVKEIYERKRSLSGSKVIKSQETSLSKVQDAEQCKKSLSGAKVMEPKGRSQSAVMDITGPEEMSTDAEQRRPSSELRGSLEEVNLYCRAPPEDSLVYTATPRTVFEQEDPSAGTNPINLTWSFGISSHLPVYNLQDEDQKLILYICAHTAVLHDFNLNRQRHLQGHCSSITCVCVSEDRRWIVTADKGPDSLIIIWDSFSGIPVQTIFDSHPEGGVVAIALSHNAMYMATVGGGKEQRVSIWNWTSVDEKAICTVELNPDFGRQDYIIFNPQDHSQLISNSASQVIFYAWEGSTLEYSAPSVTDSTFNKAVGAFSQSVFYLDTLKALSATSAGKFVVWDTVSPASSDSKPSIKPHNKRALKLMPVQKDGITVLTVYDRYFVTGDDKGQIKFFDQQLQLTHWYGNLKMGPISSISFSKTPPAPATRQTKYPQDSTLKGEQFAISNFVVSTYNAAVLHVTTDGTKLRRLLQEPYDVVHGIACHPTQPLLAIGSYSGILKVWDYKTKNQFVSRIFEKGKRLHCLSYNPDGSLLAAGFTDGSLCIMDSLTLEDDSPEPLQFARRTVTHLTFSHDSQYLATADAEYSVTVCRQVCKDENRIWEFLGRLGSHYEPIQTVIFGIHLDSDEPRLLTLGMDRMLVEYDLRNSTKGQLQIQSSDRIEQHATPKCMAWYPPVTKESFIITANDQFKMKLYNATTKMCRKTILGPTYGSPIRKMAVLPRRVTDDTSKGYLAYITDDKVGLQILPVDGNPHKSSAIICHPGGVFNLVSSCDGSYIFTAGGRDCTVMMWQANLQALEAAASLGGDALDPYYGLLEGGHDGELFREMEEYFYYAQLRSQGLDTMEPRQVSTRIPLKEAPFIMRALGFYPSEQEIEDMLNEVKFSEYVNTGKQVTDISLGELIQLYCNHRPALGISMDELQDAFKVLGTEDENGDWAIDRGELLQLLQTQGEHMTEEELAECLTTLLGLNPEGGSSETGSYDSTGAALLLEQEIPQTITSRMFAAEILGLPVLPPEPETYEDVTDTAMTTPVC